MIACALAERKPAIPQLRCYRRTRGSFNWKLRKPWAIHPDNGSEQDLHTARMPFERLRQAGTLSLPTQASLQAQLAVKSPLALHRTLESVIAAEPAVRTLVRAAGQAWVTSLSE